MDQRQLTLPHEIQSLILREISCPDDRISKQYWREAITNCFLVCHYWHSELEDHIFKSHSPSDLFSLAEPIAKKVLQRLLKTSTVDGTTDYYDFWNGDLGNFFTICASSGYLSCLQLIFAHTGVREFLKRDENVRRASNLPDTTIYFRHIEVLRLFLDHGIPPVGDEDYADEGLLILAVKQSCSEAVDVLLAHGVRADILIISGGQPRTPVTCAAERDDLELMRVLLRRGVDVAKPDYSGMTALTLAVQWRNVSMVRLLLENGVQPSPEPYNGRLLLVEAVAGPKVDVELVKLLLEYGVDGQVGDDEYEKLLEDAKGGGNDALFELLVKYRSRRSGRGGETDLAPGATD
ncbi:hypothetical protein FQN50_000568 [Emmonsiellopsis sp. PD_5]|nr:hypothetical protein FQN50_000568 [Emmonsiellopsis sp. PD_5]